MKYLLINGSPHKGNTWKLAELVKSNLQKLSPESSFEEIHLLDFKLPFCCGCSNCFRKGHEYCPHNNIIQVIIDKMDKADGVIFVTTSYKMHETALLKNLFDHLCFMLHRPHFYHSKALVITTTGGVGAKSAAKSVASMLVGIGFNKCYMLYAASYSWNNYLLNDKIKNKCNKIATRFYKDIASGKMHSPSFAVMIPYNLFRGMSLAYRKGSEFETKDGVYWIEPLRAKSTYEPTIPVPFYKKIFGNIFYWIGKVGSKMVTVTYKK